MIVNSYWRWLRTPALLLSTLSLFGCQRAPSVDILGSFFPIWIFCIVAGILLTLIARQIFLRIGIASDVGPGILIYPSLSALFAFVTWLILFR
jgi:hypothetical protein